MSLLSSRQTQMSDATGRQLVLNWEWILSAALEKEYKIKMAVKEHNWYFGFFKMLLFNGFANSDILCRCLTLCDIFQSSPLTNLSKP